MEKMVKHFGNEIVFPVSFLFGRNKFLLGNKQINKERDIGEIDHSVPVDIRFVKVLTGLQNRNE